MTVDPGPDRETRGARGPPIPATVGTLNRAASPRFGRLLPPSTESEQGLREREQPLSEHHRRASSETPRVRNLPATPFEYARSEQSPLESVRILLIHHHATLREALTLLLTSIEGLTVVTPAEYTAEEKKGRPQRPDIVLIVDGPETPALSIAQRWFGGEGAGGPPVIAVLLAEPLSDDDLDDAIRFGVRAFLLAGDPTESVVAAVRSLAAGQAWLSPPVAAQVLDRVNATRRPARQPHLGFELLSERERSVLQLIAAGMSNAEIAAELVISEATVKTHVSRLLGKLGVRDRVQAALLVRQSAAGGDVDIGDDPRADPEFPTLRPPDCG
jgi:DNA-binding NarL/FixJ family response regulator